MNLTPILSAFITLCVAVITVFAIPWLKSKTTTQGLETFLSWVKIAVEAAEQLYISTDGEEKKKYVLNFLSNRGYKVDTEEIENAIEAAVLALHTQLYGTEVTTNERSNS